MLYRIALIISLTLLFVWSLPGTIALRYLLLICGLVSLLPQLVLTRWHLRSASVVPLIPLGGLSMWMLCQATFISTESTWALKELSGQWLPALLALGLGLLLGKAAVRRESISPDSRATTWLLLGIVLVFSGQVMITIAQAMLHWLQTGSVLRQVVPLTGGKLEMSFVLNILLAFLVVDIFGRASHRAGLLPLPMVAIIVVFTSALCSLYLTGARNGLIGLVFLITSASYFFLYDQRQRLGVVRVSMTALVITILVGSFAYFSVKADPRWQVFRETALIAWDIDGHDNWMGGDRPAPLLADGSAADMSAYQRISWLRVGARLIGENPLGIGYGRNAFAHALRINYPVQLGHAHSGFVDLGVGAGVPAVILWLSFIASLLWLGWRCFAAHHRHLIGLLLIFLASGFTGRMVLDSVNRDHMLQMFFFLTGILLMLLSPLELKERSRENLA